MKKFQIKTYRIPSKKIRERTIRLAFLSDLHGSCFGEGNGQLVQAVERAEPDLVLVGGDMVTRSASPSFEAAEALLLALVERFPVYYALGNHEHRMMEAPGRYGYGVQRYFEHLRGRGVRILRDGNIQTDIEDGDPLVVWGWDGERRFYRKLLPVAMEEGYLDKILGRPGREAYHILLAHSPRFGQAYFSWGADLILSGHYHGGVCRFSENRGLIAPDLHLFPAYCCGLFTRGDRHMVVSPGLGEHTIPLRIHDPRELIVLELVHGGDV